MAVVTCPRCKKNKFEKYRGALSRKDNKTYICNSCGMKEALNELSKYEKGRA